MLCALCTFSFRIGSGGGMYDISNDDSSEKQIEMYEKEVKLFFLTIAVARRPQMTTEAQFLQF